MFSKIVDDLGIYYKIGLTTDFTGKLFNEMYSWLGFTQDKLNDVVLTPSYVATLLVRLARVNKDSYVWDFATGSAGLLVAAMNEMLNDAKNSINSPDELAKKEAHIKAHQLLGLEILSSVYMLAVLNMIMMGDGSSNILNKNSLNDFDGEYGFGSLNRKFPANAFVLNPPYSAEGNGMVFVKAALEMMSSGYAVIIIQGSSGSGKAKEINKEILTKNTLIASIKMPIDLFMGKSSVQTYIYVFKVGEKDEIVKFIDFSNDGYTRSNRKKASNNLKDTNNAKARYDELVNLVRFGSSKLKFFSKKEYYETTIDPANGADWNKTAPIDTMPTLADFKKSVSDYLSWEVSQILKKENPRNNGVNLRIEKLEREFKESGGEFRKFRVGDIFDIQTPKKKFDANKIQFGGKYPYVARGDKNNGVRGYITENTQYLSDENTISFGQDTATMFFQKEKYFTGDKIKIFKPLNFDLNSHLALYIISVMKRGFANFAWGSSSFEVKILNEVKILLPTLGGKISFAFMQSFVEELEAYLRVTGLKDYKLTKNEKDALAKFNEFDKWGGVAREFKIVDLFDIKNSSNILSKDIIPNSGDTPYLSASRANNAVSSHISYDTKYLDVGNCVFIGGKTFVVTYQEKDFYSNDSHNLILYFKDKSKRTRLNQLFFVACVEKSLKHKYSWGDSISNAKIQSDTLKLPTKDDGEIDYEFMSDFISAVQKLVIKDVVLWADKRIIVTKEAITQI